MGYPLAHMGARSVFLYASAHGMVGDTHPLPKSRRARPISGVPRIVVGIAAWLVCAWVMLGLCISGHVGGLSVRF